MVLVVSCVGDRSAERGGAPRATGPDVSWYRTLFGQSALGMTVADGQRRVIDCNDAFCRILGRGREEVMGRRFSEFNVPGDADVGGPALEAVIAGAPAVSYEKRYLRADGTATWVRINLAVLRREDDLYAGIIEDIDQRKQAEAERELALAQLREKTELLARAHEVAKLGTFAIDSRSRTMLVSAELAKMLAAGEEPFEISVDAYRDTFVHPDDREWTTRLAETAFCSGDPARWERRLVRGDGEVIWETSHMLFELDEQGRAARVMGVVQDITDRVRLVEDLRESRARIVDAGARERLRLERDLHDGAQNRLVAIDFKLARAREEAGAGADATRLDDISDHMHEAIEEIRALAHGIYPRELRDGGLDEALRSLADAAPVAARVLAEDTGRHPATIEEAIYFCAREAIQNVAKHGGTNALVTLSLKRLERALELEITDDGPGFDPREQSDGYGLASMRDRIAAVGGELETITAPGQGTRIRATVPTAAG